MQPVENKFARVICRRRRRRRLPPYNEAYDW